MEDVALEEWRRALDEFREFGYSSVTDRVADLEVLVSLGSAVLRINRLWEERIELVDWAVSQRGFEDLCRYPCSAYYGKAHALLRLGHEECALDYYLACMRRVRGRRRRHDAFKVGIAMFNLDLKPRKVRAQAAPAPSHVVRYARGLFEAKWPGRKLPVALRGVSDRPSPTWDQVHRALLSRPRPQAQVAT